jgi:hypothetical protein
VFAGLKPLRTRSKAAGVSLYPQRFKDSGGVPPFQKAVRGPSKRLRACFTPFPLSQKRVPFGAIMSLDIHPDCQRRLTERLVAVLPRIMVHNGKFLDYDSASALNELDSTLPESGKHREALTRFVGEFPFSQFVRGALQIEIYREQPYTEDKNPTPLTATERYRDVAAVAARFVTEFVSLPWKYTLTVALPHDIGNFFRRAVKTYALSTTVRIVTADDQFAAEYPPPPVPAGPLNYLRMATLANLMAGPQNEWDPNKAYLQVQVEGFIPLFGRTTPVEDGIGHIKSFFGLGIAHHLFDPEDKYGEPPTKEDLWIHRSTGGKWKFESSTDLDRAASSTLYGLAMNKALAKPQPDEQDVAFAKRTLDKIQPPFAAGAPSARILLASQWHFDSFGGSDEMLSYVQAAVVLEILLLGGHLKTGHRGSLQNRPTDRVQD